jgi:hypothetical protein
MKIRALIGIVLLAVLSGSAIGRERPTRSSARGSVNRDTNINRNTNVNQNRNVNVNRDVDIDVDVDRHYHGGYYGGGCCYHPVATAAAVTATAVVTAAVVGSMTNTLPSGCTTVISGGVAFQRCGSTWYQPQFSGGNTTYVVVNAPQ